jgi:hypothetical protein
VVVLVALALVMAFALPATAQNTSGGEEQPVDSVAPADEAGPRGVPAEGGRSAGGGESGSGTPAGQTGGEDQAPPWLPILIGALALGAVVAAVASGRARRARIENQER